MDAFKMKNDKQKKIGMNSWSLMQVDDLMKFCILDPCVGFPTRKIHPYNNFSKSCESAVQQIMLNIKISDKKQLSDMSKRLKSLFDEERLYYFFSIKYVSWVDKPIRFYLETMSSDSPVMLTKCNRYKNETNGLKVIAKVNISKSTKLRCLTGIYKPMDPQKEIILKERKLNYSVIQTTRLQNPVLMLGTAALVNHDCEPNCMYLTCSKTELIVETIKNIAEGEELYCFYSPNYFGPNNTNCECSTCEKNHKGFFATGIISSESSPFQEFDVYNIETTEAISTPESLSIAGETRMSKTKVLNSNINMSTHQDVSNITLHICTSEYIANEKDRKKNRDLFLNAIQKRKKENKIPSKSESIRRSNSLGSLYLYANRINLIESCCLENLTSANIKRLDHRNVIVDASATNLENVSESICYAIQRINHVEGSPLQSESDKNFSVSDHSEIDYKLNKAFVELEKLDQLIVDYYNVKYKDDYTFCLFCEEFKTKFKRHINSHCGKDIIDKFIINNDGEVKKFAINFLRNQGLAHFKELTGITIPVMKIRKDASNMVEKVQCSKCGAYFSKNTLWKHHTDCAKFSELLFTHRKRSIQAQCSFN